MTVPPIPLPRRIEEKYWTSVTAHYFFGVGMGALLGWRRDSNLPHVIIPGNVNPIIVFEEAELVRWAEANDRMTEQQRARDHHNNEIRLWRTVLNNSND